MRIIGLLSIIVLLTSCTNSSSFNTKPVKEAVPTKTSATVKSFRPATPEGQKDNNQGQGETVSSKNQESDKNDLMFVRSTVNSVRAALNKEYNVLDAYNLYNYPRTKGFLYDSYGIMNGVNHIEHIIHPQQKNSNARVVVFESESLDLRGGLELDKSSEKKSNTIADPHHGKKINTILAGDDNHLGYIKNPKNVKQEPFHTCNGRLNDPDKLIQDINYEVKKNTIVSISYYMDKNDMERLFSDLREDKSYSNWQSVEGVYYPKEEGDNKNKEDVDLLNEKECINPNKEDVTTTAYQVGENIDDQTLRDERLPRREFKNNSDLFALVLALQNKRTSYIEHIEKKINSHIESELEEEVSSKENYIRNKYEREKKDLDYIKDTTYSALKKDEKVEDFLLYVNRKKTFWGKIIPSNLESFQDYLDYEDFMKSYINDNSVEMEYINYKQFATKENLYNDSALLDEMEKIQNEYENLFFVSTSNFNLDGRNENERFTNTRPKLSERNIEFFTVLGNHTLIPKFEKTPSDKEEKTKEEKEDEIHALEPIATSFATPILASVIYNIVSMSPDLTISQVKSILKRTEWKMNNPVENMGYIVNPTKAYEFTMGGLIANAQIKFYKHCKNANISISEKKDNTKKTHKYEWNIQCNMQNAIKDEGDNIFKFKSDNYLDGFYSNNSVNTSVGYNLKEKNISTVRNNFTVLYNNKHKPLSIKIKDVDLKYTDTSIYVTFKKEFESKQYKDTTEKMMIISYPNGKPKLIAENVISTTPK